MYPVLMSEEPQIENPAAEEGDKWLVIYRDLIVCQAFNSENYCSLKESFDLDMGDYFLMFDTKQMLNRIVKSITKSNTSSG